MAAAAKRALIFTGRMLAVVLLAIGIVLLAIWVGSSIPRNPGWSEPEHGIDIMVGTNGVHTELVLPVVTPVKDWRETFPSAAQARGGEYPTHIAVGWGEREIFLETPTWGDLKAATALRIATQGGEGLMRIGHYVRPRPDANYRPLRLRPREYARLVARVEATLPPLPPGATRQIYRGFAPEDVNYDATGHYTLANTCNQWVGDTLAEAGVTMGHLTPFAGGVMKWVDEPETGEAQ